MDLLDIIASLFSLVILEIVLGIDNLVFLSILTERAPLHERKKARRWGLTFAWVSRLLLLGLAVSLSKFTQPIVFFAGFSFSVRDIFLFSGGAFLIAKATEEIRFEVEHPPRQTAVSATTFLSFKKVVMQVALMDIVFSLDSVLTAVGLSSHFWVMAVAITIAILVMIYASESVSAFIEKNPSVKMLALCFLILIGTALVADSFSFHIPRGYVYFAIAFSLAVEGLNQLKQHLRSNKSSGE